MSILYNLTGNHEFQQTEKEEAKMHESKKKKYTNAYPFMNPFFKRYLTQA